MSGSQDMLIKDLSEQRCRKERGESRKMEEGGRKVGVGPANMGVPVPGTGSIFIGK